jgi:hypothetical protein
MKIRLQAAVRLKKVLAAALKSFPTLSKYPTIVKAVEEIGLDNNSRKDSYYGRAEWYLTKGKYKPAELEATCKELSGQNVSKLKNPKAIEMYGKNGNFLEVLAIGEDRDQRDVMSRSPKYKRVFDFLADVFDGAECPIHSLFRGE